MDSLRLQALLGVAAFPLLLWAVSLNRQKFPFRLGAWTLGLQFLSAAVLLKTPLGTLFFKACDGLSDQFTEIAVQAARVVFGPLADASRLEHALRIRNCFSPHGTISSAWTRER